MQGSFVEKGRGIALAVAIMALAAPAAGQAAAFDVPARQIASLTLSSSQSDTSTGFNTAIAFQDPAHPGGKPYTIQTAVLHYPDGTVIDTTAPVQCAATDGELLLMGAAACPPGSRLGSGQMVSDNGAPDGSPTPRKDVNTVTAFNNQGEVILLAESANTMTRVVSRGTVAGNTVTIPFPLFPGGPGPDSFLAYNSFKLAISPLVRNGKTYMQTPPTCTTGEWVGAIDFAYRDGTPQHVATTTPCALPKPPPPPPGVKPRILIKGVPQRKCTKGSFVVAVRILNAGLPRAVAVYFDGRKAGTTQLRKFKLRVHSEGLRSGVHTLLLRVVSQNGRKASQVARFRRC